VVVPYAWVIVAGKRSSVTACAGEGGWAAPQAVRTSEHTAVSAATIAGRMDLLAEQVSLS
jgi:hypothetical protein